MSWEEALGDIGGRIRKAILEQRNGEVMYHVGRPGEDHFELRMLQAWGVDEHDSHTSVCSASARHGYTLWMGADQPSPDYSRTKFMLLLSSHLETGHYFNRHAEPEPGLPGSRRDPPTASAVPALRGRGGPDLPATIPEDAGADVSIADVEDGAALERAFSDAEGAYVLLLRISAQRRCVPITIAARAQSPRQSMRLEFRTSSF